LDIAVTLLLVAICLNIIPLVVINLKIVGLVLMTWALFPRMSRWFHKEREDIPLYWHILALLVCLVLFVTLCLVFWDDESLRIMEQLRGGSQ